jgi:hypothetical protein
MAKTAAFGTTIGKNGSTALAYVTSIKGPSIKVDVADVTTHDSTSAFEEVVATIIRTGEVTVEIQYDPNGATHKNSGAGFLAILVARAAVTWDIIMPGPKTISFSGIATGFEPNLAADGSIKATLKIKPTGVVTLP